SICSSDSTGPGAKPKVRVFRLGSVVTDISLGAILGNQIGDCYFGGAGETTQSHVARIRPSFIRIPTEFIGDFPSLPVGCVSIAVTPMDSSDITSPESLTPFELRSIQTARPLNSSPESRPSRLLSSESIA